MFVTQVWVGVVCCVLTWPGAFAAGALTMTMTQVHKQQSADEPGGDAVQWADIAAAAVSGVVRGRGRGPGGRGRG